MSGLPEGLSVDDVRMHAGHIGMAAKLINLTGDYLDAEDGSEAERVAEVELHEYVETVTGLGPHTASAVLLVFASLISAVGDETVVQSWFDEQAHHVREVLSDG